MFKCQWAADADTSALNWVSIGLAVFASTSDFLHCTDNHANDFISCRPIRSSPYILAFQIETLHVEKWELEVGIRHSIQNQLVL